MPLSCVFLLFWFLIHPDRTGNVIRRYDEFLSHLYKVWIKIDEEEVSEEEFREVYNTIAPNSFTSEELDRHVQRMCDEGKEVMKSDGMLYRIH